MKQYNQHVLSLLEDILKRLQELELATAAPPAPPGLDGGIVERVELLEKVYVLTDWQALEHAAKAKTALHT